MDTTIPHVNASDLSFFEVFRAVFYLVTPSESVFENASKVPNYVAAATPHFVILIILEVLILYWKGKDLRINDKLTSMGAGMYSQVLVYAGLKTVTYSLYSHVYNHYRVYQLPWDSAWTWIFMVLSFDVLYYWFHRMAHEVNVLWNTHQTHHSSEDYTFSTALRQSALQSYASLVFYLPAALVVPPSSYAVHAQLNLLYQFWIHTELVDSLGPLEYFMNTPSHHRVHHGRNPYCIDKNYAAVFIIWDKMFGTFQPEKKDEKVVYGIVHPINTFDSNSIQITPYINFMGRFWQQRGIINKMKFVFYGPGWSLGTSRLGDIKDIPKIENPVKIYNPEVTNWLTGYVLFHFVLALSIFNEVGLCHMFLPTLAVSGASVFVLASLTCFGYLFDKRSYGFAAEFIRCAVCFVVLLKYGDIISINLKISKMIVSAITVGFLLSVILWTVVMYSNVKIKKQKSN